QQEWPWLGVINVWFFKRASDAERDQAWYYFRLVEPDFTPLPVYDVLASYIHGGQARALYPGVHQESHWALDYEGTWQTISSPAAELGAARYAPAAGDASLSFLFEGTDLWLVTGPEADGSIAYLIDGGPEELVNAGPASSVHLAENLPAGRHSVSVRPAAGRVSIDNVTVRRQPMSWPWIVTGVIVLVILLVILLIARARPPRRWYERGRG
ncbi:MAG: hypothetical protein JXA93_24230, partial [Anaerolineae bacterium]|nr:hypothetical protein [Anaerolineae bacterium]